MNKGLHELFQKRFDAVPWDMVQHARDLYEEECSWDLFAETMFDAYTEYLERVSLNDGVNFADFMAFTKFVGYTDPVIEVKVSHSGTEANLVKDAIQKALSYLQEGGYGRTEDWKLAFEQGDISTVEYAVLMAMENQHKEKAMIKINVCHLTVLEVAEWICVSKNWEEAIELDIFYICAECGAVYLILKTDDGYGFDCPDCGKEKGLQSAFLSV